MQPCVAYAQVGDGMGWDLRFSPSPVCTVLYCTVLYCTVLHLVLIICMYLYCTDTCGRMGCTAVRHGMVEKDK
jgi:hypothetical protein